MSRAKALMSTMTVTATVTLFCGATPATAAPTPTAPPPANTPAVATAIDPLYVLRNALMLLEGYGRDLPNLQTWQFFLQHLGSLPGRAGQSIGQMLDPAQYQGPQGQQRLHDTIQKLIDDTLHLLPNLAGASTALGNPDYLPDWSHHGVYGDQADNALDGDSLSVDHAGNIGLAGKFRYPCTAPDSAVTYETESGACVPGNTPGAQFKLGEARKIQIVNSRGLRLAATLWLPEEALKPGVHKKFPMTVFTDGAVSIQSSYYEYTMYAARHGYIGLTYDEAGQGSSDGTILDLVVPYNTPHCFASGPCRDLEDVMHWAVGDSILPAPDTKTLLGDTGNLVNFWNTLHIPRLGQRFNPADNMPNPVLNLIDTSKISIWGQSMGSIASSHYLWDVGQGRGMDGRPVPKPAAAVLMSGFEPMTADVPTQIQTADLDIPGVTSGGVFPVNDIDLFGAHIGFDPTDGALGGKAWYDWVRRNSTSRAPLQFLTIKGGSHFDTQNVNLIFPQTLASRKVSPEYAVGWFDCTVKHDAGACGLVSRADPALSESVATELAPHGAAGPSYCVTVPGNQSLATALFGPLKSVLSALYGEPAPQPCVAGQPIPMS